MKNKLFLVLIFVSIFLTGAALAHAQGTGATGSYSPFKLLNGVISPQGSAWTFKLPYLGGSGTKCVQVDNTGLFAVATNACSSGGSGNVATSSAETSGYVPYWTSTGATPATLGSDSGLQFNASIDRLIVPYSTTTYASFITASTTNLIVNGESVNNLAGTNLTITAGALNVDNPLVSNVTGNLIGNADTATALAANGANCSAGSYPLGVNASGAVEDCTVAGTGGADFTWDTTWDVLNAATSSPIWAQSGINASSTSHFNNASSTGLTVSGSTYLATTDGNVGIGTTAPGASLDIDSSAASFEGGVRIHSRASSAENGDWALYARNNPYFAIEDINAGTKPLVIAVTTGNVGIGTTNPGSNLTVQATNPYIELSNGTHRWGTSIGVAGANNNFLIRDIAQSANRLQIDTSGNLGLGGTITDAAFTGASVVIKSGNVGIGTTSPFALLSVAGDGFFNGNLTAANITATGTLAVTGQTTLGYASSTFLTATTAWVTNLFIGVDTLAEYISDTAGAFFTGNTETGVSVTYQDADNTVDVVCNTADTSTFGCLTDTDWDTFNNKQATITDGDALTFSGATLNFDGGASPGGSLGGTWASPTIDDLFLLNTSDTYTGLLSGPYSSSTIYSSFLTASTTNLHVGTGQGFAYIGSLGKLNVVASSSAGFLLDTGDVGTGVFDFGGATSFEIPNGTGPTTNAVGILALDTTSNNLILATSTNGHVVIGSATTSLYRFTASTTSFISGSSLELIPSFLPQVVTAIACKVTNGTSFVINLDDGTDNTNTVTCTTTWTQYTITSNNSFTADERIRLEFGTKTGDTGEIVVDIRGYRTSD